MKLREKSNMTTKKALKMFILTLILMIIMTFFYAFEVSKISLKWGLVGFVIAVLFSITAMILNISQNKNNQEYTEKKELKKKNFFLSYEFLDWLSFLSVSLMTIFLLFTFIILPSDVSQSSMHPTLSNGDRILIYHFLYEPKKNDVVVIQITKEDYPRVPNSSFINTTTGQIKDTIFFVKRIVALTGDEVTFNEINEEEYEVFINSEPVESTYGYVYQVNAYRKAILEEALENNIVKANLYIAFGDNAISSADSRDYGAFNEQDVVGKVIFRLWPIGGIR
ncbi:MAG: signal peptidase I [Acholeplasmataceae bacterium]|nr:signal peptidase I [Acholeplasmataceae bacterium]